MIAASAADLVALQEGSIDKQSSNGGEKEVPTAREESPLTASYRQGELLFVMVRIVLRVRVVR